MSRKMIEIGHHAAARNEEHKRAQQAAADARYLARNPAPEPPPAPKPTKLRVVKQAPKTPPALAASPAAHAQAAPPRQSGRPNPAPVKTPPPPPPSQTSRRMRTDPVNATPAQMAQVASVLGRKVTDSDLDMFHLILSTKGTR